MERKRNFITVRKRSLGQGNVLLACVILFTGEGVSLSRWGLCPGDLPHGKERAVRILLECIFI